mgnify:CR=1 FL=1
MNKILKEAKKYKVIRRSPHFVADQEAMEVALAWIKDEVGVGGIAKGMGLKVTNTSDAYVLINRGLRVAKRQGKIKIVR